VWCERVEGGDREKQVGEQPMTYQLQRVAPHRLQSFSQEAVDFVDSDVERLGNQLELQMYIHEPACEVDTSKCEPEEISNFLVETQESYQSMSIVRMRSVISS
jgi:hypothetical protein